MLRIMIEPSYPLRLIRRWNHTLLSRLKPHWKMLGVDLE
jgi:hypothetical protein